MVETPGIVVITKFVRSSSNVFSSYIKYMDRDEAVNGGAIHSSYSAYSEEYMGNPEKTTGLFSMDYDQLSEEIAQIYKEQFEQAQKNGSLLWQTVVSFDNKWLEELGIYDPESQVLDEVRIRGAVRLFMKTLLDKEELHLAAWTRSCTLQYRQYSCAYCGCRSNRGTKASEGWSICWGTQRNMGNSLYSLCKVCRSK